MSATQITQDYSDHSTISGSRKPRVTPGACKPFNTPDPPIESHTELAISSLTAYYDCPSSLNGYVGVYVGLANGDADWFPCPDYEASRLYRGKRTKANPSQRTVENRVRKVRPKMDTFQDDTGILFVEAKQGDFDRETGKQGPMNIRVPCAPVITAIRKAITARLADEPDADVRTRRKIAEEATARIAPGMMGTRPRRQKDEKGEPKRTRKTMLKYLCTYGEKAMAAAIEPGNVALAAIGYDDARFEVDDTLPEKDGIKAMRPVVSTQDRHDRLLATLKTCYVEAERLGIAGEFLDSITVDDIEVEPGAGNPSGVPGGQGVPAETNVAGNPSGVPAPDPDAWTDELCAASEKEAARIGADSGDHSSVSGTPKSQDDESPKTASNVCGDGEKPIQPDADNREVEDNAGLPSHQTLEASEASSSLTQKSASYSTLTLEGFADYTQMLKDFLVCLGIGMRKDRRGKSYLGIPHLDTNGKLLGIKQRVRLNGKVPYVWVEGDAGLFGADWGFEQAREHGQLIICEGITDQLTFRWHGMPAVGLSGATYYNAICAEHLNGINEVVICRDDDDDQPAQAGMKMAKNLSRHLLDDLGFTGDVFIVKFDHAKDASEAHKQVNGDRQAFKAAFDQAYENRLSMREAAEADRAYDARRLSGYDWIAEQKLFVIDA